MRLVASLDSGAARSDVSAHVKRLVMLSTFAASPTYRATGFMKLARIAMQGAVTDKTAGETLLKRSTVDWTIVHATRLTDQPRSCDYHMVRTG